MSVSTRPPLAGARPRRSRWLVRRLRWLKPRPRWTQRRFGFVERSDRLAGCFKLGILGVTLALVAAVLATSSNGRYMTGWAITRARWGILASLGLPASREEINADWMGRRRHEIEQTRAKLRGIYAEYSPPMRRLLDHAGLDPDHALLRWGNFDKTLYLPSTVFVPDDTGRSYRFRPGVRSIWIRNLKLKGGILAYFPVPVTAELDGLARDAGALVVPGSVQTTNSWGLRGPEPDLEAPMRGILLGDSYIQGLFVGDNETPSECLKRSLSEATGKRTEVLNTGHLGYSPEQEYYTLREYAGRFRPHFVVLSLFANDFGDLFEVLEGKGDWEEGHYWIGEILQLCRTQGIECLIVPAPWVNQLEGPRRSNLYPGKICNLLECSGTHYLDPIEAFTDELLRIQVHQAEQGEHSTPNPLFNGRLGDGHFSPLGCRLWARVVGERMALLLHNKQSYAAPR